MKNLQSVPLFKNLATHELSHILQYAVTRSYKKNSVVISEGDDTDSLYVIESGSVKVYLSDNSGKEVIINTLETGDYFGELSILTTGKRSASVITMSNSSFTVIYKRDFKELLFNHPDIAYVLIENLADRVRDLTDNIKSLALSDVYGRVTKTLMDLSEPLCKESAEQRAIKKRLTQQEIANRVGSSREMVARILKDLTLGGYIELKDKKILINRKLPEHY
ncbi:MAG: Crp/Fnr family transcriptional regulator [Gammaproteobacteria bacterium]|nr:Crp/Fnr family transcriptional regulator [Gammaproteobacteria bacterium]